MDASMSSEVVANATADVAPTYIPTMPYMDRNQQLSASARHQVPPADLVFTNGHPHIQIKPKSPPLYATDSYGNPAFIHKLASVDKLGHFRHRMLTWNYDERSKAQDIIPFIFLGPGFAARDAQFIDDNQISCMVAVRSAQMVRKKPSLLHPASMPTSSGRQIAILDIDSPWEFIRNVRPVIKMVVDHMEASCQGGIINGVQDISARILVYCENGNERSAVFVAALLMVLYGLESYTAIQLIQSRRFSIGLNESMKQMLSTFETILQAEMQVGAMGTVGMPLRLKRTMSTMEEEGDESMEDAPQTLDRPGTAPFMDVSD
ncbi:Serine/threonine/tyrosine-interacting protein [Cyphellophora attinorum]|uniref:Serine/threonine/tyrosine-interacting protein n=1 Tax=Cyphellophora attinorum TaxID=1664694 RepID=A0A0N1HDQ3_9EURO|nr:Serine/threonine/tyrosine-interacting protein [Phialophora attinorum]KPI43205.1 Serine/threonine/tyrosine-interacting protein [Phialophora attinorum]